MTLTYYKDNSELFTSCVLWFTGRDQTSLGFPILPAGVTVTPNGSWTDLTSGVTRPVKNFDGSTNYISLTDNDAWTWYLNDGSICYWTIFDTLSNSGQYRQIAKEIDVNNRWFIGYEHNGRGIMLYGRYNSVNMFNYNSSSFIASANIWYHICFVKSSNIYNIYINGISLTYTIESAWNNLSNVGNQLLNIGRSNIMGCNTNGNIKDLMVFKGRALTQPEIIEIMRLTNPASGRDFAPIYPGVRGCE